MNDFSILKELETVARSWREFSQETQGWNCMTYEAVGIKVWCYFADSSDHTAVTINEVQVSFFSQTNFNNLTFQRIRDLPKSIALANKFLDQERKRYEEKSAAEIEDAKQNRVASLKRQLEELGAL